MNFFKKLFGKNVSEQPNSEIETDGKTYITIEKELMFLIKTKNHLTLILT
jgi:hypothetical protein